MTAAHHLSDQDHATLAAFLDPRNTLQDVAEAARMRLAELLAWAESDRIVPVIAGLFRIAQLRASFAAASSSPLAVEGLSRCLSDSADPVEQRRAATTIIRASTRRIARFERTLTFADAPVPPAQQAAKREPLPQTSAPPKTAAHAAATIPDPDPLSFQVIPTDYADMLSPKRTTSKTSTVPSKGRLHSLLAHAGQAELPRAG